MPPREPCIVPIVLVLSSPAFPASAARHSSAFLCRGDFRLRLSGLCRVQFWGFVKGKCDRKGTDDDRPVSETCHVAKPEPRSSPMTSRKI